MIYHIVKKRNKGVSLAFYHLPELSIVLIIVLAIINRVIFDEFINTVHLAIFALSLLFLYLVKEQFLLANLFIERGQISFSKVVKIKIDGKEYNIKYNEIKELTIQYYSYRHWIKAPYILRREDGAKNHIRIVFKGKLLEFNFLCTNYKDEKQLKSFAYNLHRKNIPIQYYVRGNRIVKSKLKIDF